LGYGAVAKCVWNYFEHYFEYDINNVYIVDKSKESIYGPKLSEINEKNIMIINVKSFNFDKLVYDIGLSVGDIIIDLTCASDTYYFINKCLHLGLNYINTSIEDCDDDFYGASIDVQQKTVYEIYKKYTSDAKPKSNILIEFGQNPGLIQHYVLYALNKLNQMSYGKMDDNYDINYLKQAIIDHKIGTILMSEIDEITSDKFKSIKGVQYNSWCVAGLFGEGLDKVELAFGKGNKFIKPLIPKHMFDIEKTSLSKNNNYKIIFLNDYGLNSNFNSICPVIDEDDQIIFKKFDGALIHHGELFELARLFGKDAPFMAYVYKINEYARKSFVENFGNRNQYYDWNDVVLGLLSDYSKCQVLENIKINNMFSGFDSIGCTLFCGKDTIDKIYWCGSVLDSNDPCVDKSFTPTIVQVAAGVLSGLSYILETANANRGLLFPCDLDTKYILNKSVPMLGKFFFTEIPTEDFDKTIEFRPDVIL
jgi:homospermidine synthase